MIVPLSLLDLTVIAPNQTPQEALAASVTLARRAEELGYKRVWYAEHHNNARIASSSPAVFIAHVAAHTKRIRLGAGGVMLPNHSPLVIAEQFSLLETLHPGRIDLALGRAPGTDHPTMLALRRSPGAADRFPEEVAELQGYLDGKSLVRGVEATPGRGTHVPLYILGSSLFGASLAASLGLPYAFASQFAPDALQEAVTIYRREFRPSAYLDAPYVLAGLNVLVADTREEAQEQFLGARRALVGALLMGGRRISDEEADAILDSPAGERVRHLLTYSAVGTPADVRDYAQRFVRYAQADELMVALQSPGAPERLRSLELLALALTESPSERADHTLEDRFDDDFPLTEEGLKAVKKRVAAYLPRSR
jgi:luciferase family oxidoreductase group 1